MCEDDDDDSVDVEVLYDGSFRACLSEPAIFFSQIIGAKGATKLRIEKECGSRIFVPRQGSTGDIIVTSKLRKNVLTALRRIKLICLEARKKASCTHFCSIFFASPEIKSNFEKFKVILLMIFKTILLQDLLE